MNIRIVLCCLACATAHTARAGDQDALASTDNPYAVISDRNVFHLNPEPVAPPYEPPKPELPALKLSGFVANGGRVRALFASFPKNPKDPELYYDLAEGDRDGFLQLVKIHMDQQEADVINSGVPMRLTMHENGFESSAPKVGNHLAATDPREPVRPPALPQPGRRGGPHG